MTYLLWILVLLVGTALVVVIGMVRDHFATRPGQHDDDDADRRDMADMWHDMLDRPRED